MSNTLCFGTREMKAQVDPVSREVTLPTPCPACGTLVAFRCKATGRVLALGPRFHPAMGVDFPTIDPTPHLAPPEWRALVVSVEAWVGRRRPVRLQCVRCGRVELLAEVYQGIFGADEDDVLLGAARRYRVYGEES